MVTISVILRNEGNLYFAFPGVEDRDRTEEIRRTLSSVEHAFEVGPPALCLSPDYEIKVMDLRSSRAAPAETPKPKRERASSYEDLERAIREAYGKGCRTVTINLMPAAGQWTVNGWTHS